MLWKLQQMSSIELVSRLKAAVCFLTFSKTYDFTYIDNSNLNDQTKFLLLS